MRKVISVLCVILCVLSLVGCGNTEAVKSLQGIKSVDSEANVTIVSLSATDKENLIYSQVSNRTLLDLSTLESPTVEEVEAVKVFMDSVDAQLIGSLPVDNGVIDECFTNYLLFEFEKTPFYWQRSSMSILGVDASSRSIVLDVVYNTIDFKKIVKGDSTIIKGEPSFDIKSRVRQERYLKILNGKYSNNINYDWESELSKFESVYGSVDTILAEQQNTSLTETVFNFGNQLSYNGLINSDAESSSTATMTVRYVLTPSYSLGVNLGLSCSHMYIVGYKLNSDELDADVYASKLYEDETGITEEVKEVLRRYYICIDDENFSGLYSLVRNFGTLDKYFSDYFNTTYRKHEDFSLTLHSVVGTRIECTTRVSRKVRAKGSTMSLPIYTDTYFYVLSLDDGLLKIEEETLLSSKLEGEPAITTTDAEVSGFSTSISLSAQDKLDLEGLIADFGVLQLNGDTTSVGFFDTVDTSISSSQISSLKDNMRSIEGVQKVTWITSYLQGYESYASIRCKELVQKEDGVLYDCVVTYDFLKKGRDWYICGYTVNSKNKLDTTSMSTKNCLCLVSKDGVEVMDSKVTVKADDAGDSGVVVGVTVEYDMYIPTPKVASEDISSGQSGVSTESKNDLIDRLIEVSPIMSKLEWDILITSNPGVVETLEAVLNDLYLCRSVEGHKFSTYLGTIEGIGCDSWLTEIRVLVEPYSEGV